MPSQSERGAIPPQQPGKTAGLRIQSAAYVIDLRTRHHHHHQIPFAKPRAKRHNAGAHILGGHVLIYLGGPAISKNKLWGNKLYSFAWPYMKLIL